ncbi:MAG: hypothetical protein H0W36_12930 [Gemmatimonadetes bacterium]|nr:hypothetical protein [Gemmatimonadota bacterium]
MSDIHEEPPVHSEGATGSPTSGQGGLSVPLGVHFLALREADLAFNDERDRRYTELAVEREKAIAIKDAADLTARERAREIQDYKDSKAETLRDQFGSERGIYATKTDLADLAKGLTETIRPLVEYVTAAQAGQVVTTRNDSRADAWRLAFFAAAIGGFGIFARSLGL